METFTAIPSFVKLPITVVDQTALQEWMDSEDADAPIPTKTKLFVCYEKGIGTPVPVQIEVDRIDTEYQEQRPRDEEAPDSGTPESLSLHAYVDKWRRVNMLLRRNLLLAVVRGLDTESANVLSGEDGHGRTILERLGWIAPLTQVQEEEEAEENKEEGEVNTVDETGESTSLTSQPSTQE